MGCVLLKTDKVLEKGINSFALAPGSGSMSIFTAQWRGKSSSIKILHASTNSNKTASLKYIGNEALTTQLKATEDIQNFSFSIGDMLLYIGYTNGLQSGMLDAPEANETYTFQFATNITCPGTPTVTYEGHVYNTIQIFSQCWLKENLNVGMLINGNEEMTDNGSIEKYCFDNSSANCDTYGGLYQWNEMMQYATTQGVQGICPPDWHIPTDDEWKTLEGTVDSQYPIGNPEWDGTGARGIDVGLKLKSLSGWNSGGNGTDAVGFTALPGGYRLSTGDFSSSGNYGYWWVATELLTTNAWGRRLGSGYGDKAYRNYDGKGGGVSVRCLKD